MEIQAVLTSLKTFNLLTEDAHARKLLYNVCQAGASARQKFKCNLNDTKLLQMMDKYQKLDQNS